jgi:inner membrane protein
MTAKGHIILGLTAGVEASYYISDSSYLVLFLGAVFLGSVLPDIDEPNSFIGRKFAFLSIPLKVLGIKHRTITHYFLFPLFLFLIGYFCTGYIQIILYGLSLGIFMHDVGDMLTKGGIRGFFYPFFKDKTIRLLPKKYSFYTNSLEEYLIIFLMILGLLSVVLVRFDIQLWRYL